MVSFGGKGGLVIEKGSDILGMLMLLSCFFFFKLFYWFFVNFTPCSLIPLTTLSPYLPSIFAISPHNRAKKYSFGSYSVFHGIPLCPQFLCLQILIEITYWSCLLYQYWNHKGFHLNILLYILSCPVLWRSSSFGSLGPALQQFIDGVDAEVGQLKVSELLSLLDLLLLWRLGQLTSTRPQVPQNQDQLYPAAQVTCGACSPKCEGWGQVSHSHDPGASSLSAIDGKEGEEGVSPSSLLPLFRRLKASPPFLCSHPWNWLTCSLHIQGQLFYAV